MRTPDGSNTEGTSFAQHSSGLLTVQPGAPDTTPPPRTGRTIIAPADLAPRFADFNATNINNSQNRIAEIAIQSQQEADTASAPPAVAKPKPPPLLPALQGASPANIPPPPARRLATEPKHPPPPPKPKPPPKAPPKARSIQRFCHENNIPVQQFRFDDSTSAAGAEWEPGRYAEAVAA